MQESLKLFFLQFICVYFVQSIIFVASLYVFTDRRVERKRFIPASVILMLGTVLIRALPIHFGVHTLISLLLSILIGTKVLKLPVYSAVTATLTAAVVLLIVESANVFFLNAVLGEEGFEALMSDRYLKNLFGLPANLLFLLVVAAIYFLKRRALGKKKTHGGEEEREK